MATDNQDVNGITYYGIATYGDLSSIIGDIDFDDDDRCLSKEAADEIDTIKYKDDGDHNEKKLLRYAYISPAINNIDIYFKNTKDYTIYIAPEPILFTFYDSTMQKTYTHEIKRDITNPLGTPISPGYSQKYAIPNYRNAISFDKSTLLQLGTVTISFTVTTSPAATLLCTLKNSENNKSILIYASTEKKLSHDIICTLQNIASEIGGYVTNTLLDYWPQNATSITFELA